MFKYLLSLLLLVSAAQAQNFNVIRNDNADTVIQSNNLGNAKIATDSTGKVFTTLQAGTASATNPIKLEDSASARDDALMGVAAVVNNPLAVIAGTNGDYVAPAASRNGVLFSSPVLNTELTSAQSPIDAEDSVAASGDALVVVGGITRSALINGAATGDYVPPAYDESSRTITTLAPTGETWQACTGAITDTTQTAIKAAVASNKIYITSIGCNNSSAVASTLVFQDASTAIWQGAITAAATNGSYTMTFPVPLRGTVNTALNVTLGTTATNTRCCAAGYISVN